MPKAKRSLYLLLVKKTKHTSGEHRLKAIDDSIEKLELNLERAKRRKQTQLIIVQQAESMMERHLEAAIKQACFVQENAIVQVVLAVHPLSREPAIGRLMMSFLTSIEIKSLRSTCRAMTCFVHVQCEEIAIPKKLYIGRDRHGWKNWGIRHVLAFKAK